MISLLSFFWIIRTAKAALFWLYLWQLKEYHVGRFREHFRTFKGKRLLLHPAVAAKAGIFFLWWFSPVLALLLLALLYVGEAALAAKAALKRTLLSPVFTSKMLVLALLSLLLGAVFLWSLFAFLPDMVVPALLLADVFLPLVVSTVVLLLQPFTALWRRRVMQLAKEKRTKLAKLNVVGITGSYGKTTTKEILFHILQKKFVAVKTPEHRNSEIGIAHTILYDLTDEHEVFVCEMGAYNKGGIRLLADMAQPTLGVVTGVNEQHLGVFGDGMSLFSAEGGGELVEALRHESTLVLNDDSRQLHELGPWLQLWNPYFTNYFWCSTAAEKELYAKGIVVGKDRVRFTAVLFSGETAEFNVPIGGRQSVENILLAGAAAVKLGMTLKETAEALEDLPASASPLQLKQGKEKFDVVDASYSANPTGVKAALEYLKFWEGKKIVVMPSLIELGKASWQVHVELGRMIGEVCDYAVITSRDEFAALQKGALERGMKKEHMVALEDPGHIASKLADWAGKGDVVLLEGRVPKNVAELLSAP